MRDTSPILYISFFFKIKFSVIKQDSDTSNIKLILLLIAHSIEMHIRKILKKKCQCLCALLGT